MISNPGPNGAIARQYDRQSQVTVGIASADSTGVDVRAAAGLQMIVPAGAASQTVAVHVSDTLEGTYVPLNNTDGAVTFDVAESQAYDLPEALFAAHFVKFVAGTTQFVGLLLAKG